MKTKAETGGAVTGILVAGVFFHDFLRKDNAGSGRGHLILRISHDSENFSRGETRGAEDAEGRAFSATTLVLYRRKTYGWKSG